jgi:hypothetical protein
VQEMHDGNFSEKGLSRLAGRWMGCCVQAFIDLECQRLNGSGPLVTLVITDGWDG